MIDVSILTCISFLLFLTGQTMAGYGSWTCQKCNFEGVQVVIQHYFHTHMDRGDVPFICDGCGYQIN